MLEIGLTGCRYSGKTSVAKLFKQIGVPVFNADTVIKFILNYRTDFDTAIKTNVGTFVFKNGVLDPDQFITDSLFDRTIDVIEFELFQAYERFKHKNLEATYVIFESSILFEREWDRKFDKVISIFAPKEERVYRCKIDTDDRVDQIWSLFDKEMSELSKNNKSDYVIHNYDTGPDVLTQINNIDLEVINSHLAEEFLF